MLILYESGDVVRVLNDFKCKVDYPDHYGGCLELEMYDFLTCDSDDVKPILEVDNA
jgi:hypothetical protein